MDKGRVSIQPVTNKTEVENKEQMNETTSEHRVVFRWLVGSWWLVGFLPHIRHEADVALTGAHISGSTIA